MTAPALPFTRIAVFGAGAPERAPALPTDAQELSPAARAVLERVLASIESSASSIAQPILDRAVEAGLITRAERHDLLRELSAPSGRDDGPASAGASPTSLAARRVLREALAAIRRAAPGIAQPILDEAVGAERLTAAQQKRILERLRINPSQVLRPAARGGAALPA